MDIRSVCWVSPPTPRSNWKAHFPESFFYIPERIISTIFIYGRSCYLTGKKYQSKRNHINNFKKRYSYEYVPITPDIVPQCLKLECKWYKANNGDNDEEELNDERRSLTYALHHFDSLGLIGGALRVDNEIIAFSFGAPINHNTFGVHVEKADVNFDGAYTVINQEFASHLPEQYTYVNGRRISAYRGCAKRSFLISLPYY